MTNKKNHNYLISAVISAYNAEAYMIGRLQNLIDQPLFRRNHLEIIVVDSCSQQSEGDIVKDFMRQHDHIIYVRTPERESVYSAWNRGIQLASGSYVINANTDDRFTEKALTKLADVLNNNPDVDAVYGDWLQTEIANDTPDSDSKKELLRYPEFDPLLLFHGQITSHATMIRKKVFDKIGLYDPGYSVYGDREFMLRFALNGLRALKVPEVVGLYYSNSNGLEHSQKEGGTAEFNCILDTYLAPENFVRLSNARMTAEIKNIADLYARAGSRGKTFFSIDGRCASNLGTAGMLFTKALEHDGTHVLALNNLGVIAALNGQTDEAAMLLEKALSNADTATNLCIRENIARLQQECTRINDYNWLDQNNQIVKENAMKSPEEMYADIQPLIENGWDEVAVGALEKFIDLYPDFAMAHNDLGVLYYNSGRKDRSQTCYETAAALQPANIIFQKNLADFYYVEQGRVEAALKIYVGILESHPEDTETLLITGHICVALQKFGDARSFYRRVLEIDPWNTDAGQNLEKLEKIKTGEPAAAPVEQPQDEPHLSAHTAAGQNHADNDIQKLESLLQTSPDNATAHNDLGVLYYKRGDKDRAREHYEMAAKLAPGEITFQKNLADFYCVETDQLEKALQIYVRVLEKCPEDVEALMAIGYICEALDRQNDAKDFYHRVLEIEPWNMAARQKFDSLNGMPQAMVN